MRGAVMPVARALLTATVLLPGSASAHLVSTRFGELYSGMLHPVTSLIHLVPWLALGLLGGLQSATTARWALLAFPLAVLAGAMLAGFVPGLALVTPINIASFMVLGMAVALALRTGTVLFLALVVLFGITHGYANGNDALNGAQWLLYAAGLGLSAYLLIALVTGSCHALVSGPPWGGIAVRAAGSWIAAAGLMYAGFLTFAA